MFYFATFSHFILKFVFFIFSQHSIYFKWIIRHKTNFKYYDIHSKEAESKLYHQYF